MDPPVDTWAEVAHIPDELLLEAWQLFLAKRHGLSPADVWGMYGRPRTGLSKARKAELWRDREWRRWAGKVTAIRVELKPGGRAVCREPEQDAVFTVEIQWAVDHKTPAVVSVAIVPDDYLAFNEDVDLSAYMLACRIELSKDAPKRARLPKRPKPGEARDLAFFRWILGEYEALIREADPAPARTLANRNGLNYSTVKSYLKRGREYLREEEK